jgi:hypothetical protein
MASDHACTAVARFCCSQCSNYCCLSLKSPCLLKTLAGGLVCSLKMSAERSCVLVLLSLLSHRLVASSPSVKVALPLRYLDVLWTQDVAKAVACCGLQAESCLVFPSLWSCLLSAAFALRLVAPDLCRADPL